MLSLPIYPRNGTYYLHTRIAGRQIKRSLATKDKTEAILVGSELLKRLYKALKATGGGMDKDDYKKLDIAFPTGFQAKINTDDDMARFQELLKNPDFYDLIRPRATEQHPTSASEQPAQASEAENLTGVSIVEVASRYQTRHQKLKAPKTLYEYGNYHQHFSRWVAVRKQADPYPIRSIINDDIAAYIDDLLADGKPAQAIQTKYLRALNALFEFAKTLGAFPKDVPIPTRGHKVFNKNKHRTNRKPFTTEELQQIFEPLNLNKARHPEEYWLPLLGLFTGGRISELSQLLITDIKQIEGTWTISINDEGDKRAKTLASIRTIPIHPTLLEIGFLDYVEDMKGLNGQLFPDLHPDKFGHYGKQPSQRFGVYLDKLGITDRAKVFHSFRTTANNCLKQNGVPEETRCQFIGHEHDTINSATYGEPHSMAFLLEHAAKKLIFEVDFQKIKYEKGRFNAYLVKEIRRQERMENHKVAKKSRG